MKKHFTPLLLCFTLSLCTLSFGCTSTKPVHEAAPAPLLDKSFTLSAVGDIMMHNTQIQAGYQPQLRTYDFSSFFTQIKPFLQKSDFVIGNLEVTLGKDPSQYSGYPRFNSPAILAENLKEAGFDLLTTANNHCLDKGIHGLNNTLDCLDEAGLLHVGTARNEEEKENFISTEIAGVKITILSYTYGANGLKPPRGKEFAVNFLEEKQVLKDLEKARTQGAKLIVLCLHFGKEYHEYPDSAQIHLAQTFLNAGADVILGTHPHVLQRSQTYELEKGGKQYVIYSLGNFISDQRGLVRKASVILHLHFGVDALTAEPYFKEATYDPIWTRKYKKEGRTTFEVLPLEPTLAKIRRAEVDDFTIKEIQELEHAQLHISSYLNN